MHSDSIPRRLLLAAALALCFFTSARAQPVGRADIVVHFGGPGSDGANAVISMANGGYALAGWKAKDGAPRETQSWLLRLDARGRIVWDIPLPDSAPYGISALSPTLDGGLFTIDGAAESRSGLTRLTKITHDGSIERQVSFGNTPEDALTALRPTFDGGVIAAGRTTYRTHGRSDGWILKLNKHLEIEWFRTLGTALEDGFEDVALAQNGEYTAVGWTTRPGDTVMGWLVSVDANGALRSEAHYDLGTSTEIHSIEPTPNSIGVFAATVDVDSGTGRQFIIGEFGSLGETRWQRTIGAGVTALASDLTISSDGTYLVSATIKDQSGQAGLVVNFSSDGEIAFANTHKSGQETHALAVAPRHPRGYALAGSSRRSAGLDQDIWLVIRSAAELTELTGPEPAP